MPDPSSPPPTYWDYLNLDQLLSLQGGLEGDESKLLPDELHFILSHQTLELWLKLVLAELRLARDHLAAEEVPEDHVPYVVHHLRRVIEILKLAVAQFDVVETLTPRDFLGFRDKLVPASGFQSFQLREVEIVMGLRDDERVTLGGSTAMEALRALSERSPKGAQAWDRIERAHAETTLRAALQRWLHRTPIQGSTASDPGDAEVVDGFLAAYLEAWRATGEAQRVRTIASGVAPGKSVSARFEASFEAAAAFLSADDRPADERDYVRRVRAAVVFVESYRELPLLAWPRMLLDTAVELEQRFLLFRHRHARMAERLIGRRVGTGGSAGVDYLDKTSSYRIFKDLWAARTVFLDKGALPPLQNPAVYGFAR